MPTIRTDIARAFLAGREAANSTRSFRAVHEPTPNAVLDGTPYANLGVGTVTILYTYNVPLAVRLPDGTVHLPAYDGWRAYDALDPVPNLLRRYGATSTIHQHALLVALPHATCDVCGREYPYPMVVTQPNGADVCTVCQQAANHRQSV